MNKPIVTFDATKLRKKMQTTNMFLTKTPKTLSESFGTLCPFCYRHEYGCKQASAISLPIPKYIFQISKHSERKTKKNLGKPNLNSKFKIQTC